MANNQFVPLLNHEEDYEIMTEYPYIIRRKNDHKIISENLNGDGYARVALNGKDYYKHRLIADQFLPNPDNLPCVDHINHDRTDYHLLNLRWVSSSMNSSNKTSHKGIIYEFYNDIPDESIRIIDYQSKNKLYVFDDDKYYYYYDEENDEDVFYMKVDENYYRKIHINVCKNGSIAICCMDIDHKHVFVCIKKFKKQYDLM